MGMNLKNQKSQADIIKLLTDAGVSFREGKFDLKKLNTSYPLGKSKTQLVIK